MVLTRIKINPKKEKKEKENTKPKTSPVEKANGLISVIVPHYKVPDFKEDYLEEALEALAKQTYNNFEVRVCLDVPDKDYIIQVIELIEKFKNLKIFLSIRGDSEPNVSKTRNVAMASAKGDWFAFLDSDNLWDPNWLHVMYNKAKEIFPDIAYCVANNMYNDIGDQDIIEKEYWKNYLNNPTKPLFGQCIVHRSHLEKVGFWFDSELLCYETSLMLSKLLEHFRLIWVKDTKVYCRPWTGSISIRMTGKYANVYRSKARKYHGVE